MVVASSSLRILVDLTHLRPGGEVGGIKPALREMLGWLGQQNRQLTFIYISNPAMNHEITAWLRPADRLVSMHHAPSDLAARENCNLVYCPFGITDWACPGIPTVTLIVDLLHKDFPESLLMPDRSYRAEYFRATMERTDLFQVISAYTAGQLHKHYQVEPGRIIRTYLPIHVRLLSPVLASRERVSQPYFFYPANAWAHKNHETLLLAYALYRQAAGTTAWRLVLTGHRDAAMLHLQSVAASLCLSAHVDFLGYVDEPRLAALWDRAGALVFPSLHEGFGLPLLEAMARGVPILASNSTAIPEITETAALLVDGRAPLALADGMQKIAADPQLRLTLMERGRARLADFSPEIEFGRLLHTFYTTAAKASRWRHFGYHSVDGLTDPLSIFGLPASPAPQELFFVTRPLGVSRILEFWCGSRCLSKIEIAAHGPTEGRLILPAEARVLSLRVSDATRLSSSDPRTHGVLLERLHTSTSDGVTTDLLVPLLAQ